MPSTSTSSASTSSSSISTSSFPLQVLQRQAQAYLAQVHQGLQPAVLAHPPAAQTPQAIFLPSHRWPCLFPPCRWLLESLLPHPNPEWQRHVLRLQHQSAPAHNYFSTTYDPGTSRPTSSLPFWPIRMWPAPTSSSSTTTGGLPSDQLQALAQGLHALASSSRSDTSETTPPAWTALRCWAVPRTKNDPAAAGCVCETSV